MRKILVLVLLLFASVAFAAEKMEVALNPAVIGGVAGEGCACAGGIWSNGVVERFEKGAGDWCTQYVVGTTDWTTSLNGGTLSTYDTAQYKTCGHSASFTTTADSQYPYIQADITDSGTFAVDFWFYISNFTNWGNNEYVTLVNFIGETVRIYHSDPANIRMYLAFGVGHLGTYNMSAATWYRLHVNYVASGTSTLYLYDSSNVLKDTIVATDTAAGNSIVIRFGVPYSTTNASTAYTVYVDDITFDSNGD